MFVLPDCKYFSRKHSNLVQRLHSKLLTSLALKTSQVDNTKTHSCSFIDPLYPTFLVQTAPQPILNFQTSSVDFQL